MENRTPFVKVAFFRGGPTDRTAQDLIGGHVSQDDHTRTLGLRTDQP